MFPQVAPAAKGEDDAQDNDLDDLEGEDFVEFALNRGVLVAVVTLVEDDLAVFTGVDDDSKH